MLFKLLGVLLAIYTGHAAYTGTVSAKQGFRRREICRVEEPRTFWTVIVIYAGLSVALLTVF